MGKSEVRYTLSTKVLVTTHTASAWFHCPRCGRDGYAGTLGHGCTDCDNHFSHGLPDPLDTFENEGGISE